MPLVCLGLSHNSAPLDVRARHAFPPERMAEALVALKDYAAVREAAMLSTCGRLEIYAELDDYETGVEQLKSFLKNFRHGDVEHDLSSYLYTLLGDEAVGHLFRVSTGLDSMLIGEAEILGQVKDAYVQAHRAGSLGTTLHALFRDALGAGKAARSQTRIGHASTSLATAAVEAAKRHAGALHDKTVLVIGAGKMGSLAAKRARAEGCRDLIVANRTHGGARSVVEHLGSGEALELPGLAQALERADVAITSTGASHFILGPQMVSDALAARPQRPLLIVDLAVPRDADPAVAALPGVTLLDVDTLAAFVAGALDARREEIPLVEEIIAEYSARFRAWYASRAAIPTVASLVQRAEAIRAAEIERLFARCPDLGERERMLIAGASLTIISKLLHSVVTRVREKAAGDRGSALEFTRVLDELFELRSPAE